MWIKILIIFIFVFSLLLLNIPQLEKSDRLGHKLYIFCGVFLFEFITVFCTTMYHKRVIDISRMVKQSLQSALIAVVGYSVYVDLSDIREEPVVEPVMPPVEGQPESQPTLPIVSDESSLILNLKMTTVIILFISAGYVVDYVFQESKATINDCLNLIYQKTDNKTKN